MAIPPSDLPTSPEPSDPRPIVRLPRQGLPGAAIAIGAGILALLLFLTLDANRRHRLSAERTTSDTAATISAPPPLTLPPEQAPVMSVPVEATPLLPQPVLARPTPVMTAAPPVPAPKIIVASPTPAEPPQKMPLTDRSDRSGLVYDGGEETTSGSSIRPTAGGGTTTGAGAAAGSGAGSDARAVSTASIGNHATIMPMGTVIPAVLETPIDSTRPGLVRAIVSEDARGFDGKHVLIPRGSRLIGDYASDVRSGQNRVLVNWNRLIRPDGTTIQIGSPAADALGGAGIPGKVDTFFFRRFAGALLQSALAVGVNLASRPGNGSIIVGLPNASTGVIGQDLVPGSDLRPRIRVEQGALLDIFVAHDLDFGAALPVERTR